MRGWLSALSLDLFHWMFSLGDLASQFLPHSHLSHRFIMSTRSSYNETTIVSLVKEYYSLLIALSYIHPSQIVNPPPCNHIINESICKQLGLDAAVISLMKKLPYIDGPYSDGKLDEEASAYGCMLFPGSCETMILWRAGIQRLMERREGDCIIY